MSDTSFGAGPMPPRVSRHREYPSLGTGLPKSIRALGMNAGSSARGPIDCSGPPADTNVQGTWFGPMQVLQLSDWGALSPIC